MNLRGGFTLGDWTVYPLEGRIVGDAGEVRVQPKSMDVLLCLAEQAGKVVERDDILRQVWGERAQSDEPLTRCIGELRRALGDVSSEPEYIMTIPKRGYRLLQTVVSIEEPDADFVGGPGKLTEAQSALRMDTLKKLGIGVSLIIVAVFAELLLERFLGDTWLTGGGSSPPPENSIAVLPFVNLSIDRDYQWFADGLTEELLITLTRVPDLLVSSRTSTFHFRGANADARSIASQLGVAHLIEGSVRRSDDRLRIVVQLTRAADGFQSWSETFDRTVEDVIVMQEDIAFAIANALEVALDPDALAAMVSAGTGSVPAYEQYLEAIALTNRYASSGNIDDIRSAMLALDNAVAIDDQFASAHYRLAELWRQQMALTTFTLDLPALDHAAQMEKFESAIRAAIESTRYVPEKNLYQAKLAQVELRFRDAIRSYNDYLAVRPNDHEAWFWLAQVYQQVGEFDNAFAAIEEAQSHPGLDATLDSQLLWTYYRAGRAAEGAKAARELLEIIPTHATALYQGHRALLWAGHVDQARDLLPRIESSSLNMNQKAAVRLRQACAEGRAADADAAFATTNLAELSWVLLQILGKKDDAIDAIRHLDQPDRHYQLSGFMVYPYFDPTPFPNLQYVLTRENVRRPQPVEIPYACQLN